MLKRRFLVLFILAAFLTLTAFAAQSTDSQNGTIEADPDQYVEIVMTNDTIDYGTLNISDQYAINHRSDVNGKYVIFDSETLVTGKTIDYNNGASNANTFSKVTYTGEAYPAVNGLNNTAWLFLKDNVGTGYVQTHLTGTLTLNGGGVTMPTGVNEVGSYAVNFISYSNGGSGTVWTRGTKTIYVALGDDTKLYVSDSANLTGASSYSAKGDVVSTPFAGNNFAETSTFPTVAGDTVTLDFGADLPWNSVQGNDTISFSALIDVPMNAAYNHNWTWNLTITGEFKSAV